MDTALLDQLRRRRLPVTLLAEAGEPEAERAAEAFLEAAADPDLGPCVELWAPALARSARPGFGAECLLGWAAAWRRSGGAALVRSAIPALARLFGASSFLARLLIRHPEWGAELRGPCPEPPEPSPPPARWEAIRLHKYRGLIRIAARDLAGRPFRESLRELSDLADACLRAALAAAARDTAVAPPALLALGKLGGRELNFSSDVDLLFLYEAEAGARDLARNREVARLVQRLKGELEKPTPDGFAYRVDLDLRPEGPTGVLANSVEAALDYYESFGAEWERQALIRLRAVAGPREPSRRFLREIEPFVYRRTIGTDVLGAVREMKERIELERRRAGRDLERDLKEGPGGIRDLEFLVQALQLLYGGREPALRVGHVLEALEALARLGVLRRATAEKLAECYTWLRRAEHALQMDEERQTHRFPADPDEQLRLARRMGYDEPAGERARAHLLDDWTTMRSVVREAFEDLTLGGSRERTP